MIPILTAEQMRAADQHTITNEPVTSIDLMERAAKGCTQRIVQLHREGAFGWLNEAGFVILAGMGNNGGDGLAIARLLKASGMNVRIIRILHSSTPSPDNEHNLQRANSMGLPISELREGEQLHIEQDELVIDALFGTGLNKPLQGWLGDLVRRVNAYGRPVIAIDMPSGLFAGDNAENDHTAIVRATVTLTFEVPKLSQLLADNASFVGRCEVIPIGLDRGFIDSLDTAHFLAQERDVVDLLPSRPRHGHKGTFGHALVIAGSAGKAGAAVLAVSAAFRSGAGLVSAHVPGPAIPIIQSTTPEAMCTANDQDHLTELPPLDPYTAIGIGPGLGTADDTALMVKKLIQSASSKLVFDADALNILSENQTWLSFLPPSTILTPHPKEFDRLHGSPSTNDHERLANARVMAMKYGCIVILKGARTAVCDPTGKVFFNSNGNPGMAKGGSGDALTGLLTGLLAQNITPLQAAILGVHLHGSAGDHAAAHRGMDGMTVRDLIKGLPEAWKRLRNASDEIVRGTLPFAQDAGFTL
jgi:ADP-dependent NAD(P)H-hydrate dehydratase / NAD(P)H-hydrate epimerase